jgi:photosystem II stability/assembly factor-like uncharacterized protein
MFCSIHFSDSENGTVIGEMGAIYTTTDGGEIWTSQKKGYSDLLTSVWFTSPSIGIAVGDNGTILRTNDYGRNWNLMPSLTSKKINKLFFTNQNNGYAVGDSGTIIKSTNGGADWSLLNSPVHSELRSVLFLDSLNGLVVGDDACLIRTTDKGQNWSVINLGLGYGYMLSSISIKNSQTIYVSGTDATTDIVIKSTDSGISWDLCEDDKISVKYFIDNNNGFGLSGWQVFKTTNGGDTWGMQYQCKLGLYTISMSFPLPETGYILAAYDPLVCGDFQGALLKTTNGGLNWSLALLPNYGSLQSQCFINIDTGYVVGEFGCILKTTDGGISWDYQGKENYTSQKSFKIYPNPSTDFIVFEIMPDYLSKFENIELSIFDMNGRVKLKQFIYKPYYVFNVTDFSQGIYTAKVSFQDGQSDIIKFIVLKK